MNSIFQIDIPKRNLNCSHKGERLSPGTDYFSLLLEEGEGIVRKDYCMACWEEIQPQIDLARSHSYWKSRVEDKKEAVESSRIDKALTLLKLLLLNPADHEPELFVLAMYLCHARRLVLRREKEKEGVKYGVYEILKQDESVTIKTVPLSHLETARLQQSVVTKLQKV